MAPPFEVLDALAAGQDIEGDVEHMVGFVVRPMPLEQMESAVDFLDELDLLSHQKDGADAAGTEPAGATGRLVVDVGGGHHGYGPLGAGRIGEPFLDSPSPLLEGSLLACSPFSSESGAHSKAPFVMEY